MYSDACKQKGLQFRVLTMENLQGAAFRLHVSLGEYAGFGCKGSSLCFSKGGSISRAPYHLDDISFGLEDLTLNPKPQTLNPKP